MELNKYYIQSCLESEQFKKNASYDDGIIRIELVIPPCSCRGIFNEYDSSMHIVVRGRCFDYEYLVPKGVTLFDVDCLVVPPYRKLPYNKPVKGINITRYLHPATSLEKRKIE
jgi:hypothetical protein